MATAEESFCGIAYEAQAEATIKYSPSTAPETRGFGRWEIHPQKIPQLVDGSLELVYNGHWLAVDRANGKYPWLAWKASMGGKQGAEMWAALNNDGLPTRVVDLDESESKSIYTEEIVRQKAVEKGICLD